MNPVKQQFKQVLLLHNAHVIAKPSKPFTNGGFIKECQIKSAELLPDKQHLFKNISFSAITEIASDLQMQLKEKIPNFAAISIAIVESTDITDVAQLAVFVQGVTDGFEIIEDLLEVMPMKGRTSVKL